jgi:hypothetical protein
LLASSHGGVALVFEGGEVALNTINNRKEPVNEHA